MQPTHSTVSKWTRRQWVGPAIVLGPGDDYSFGSTSFWLPWSIHFPECPYHDNVSDITGMLHPRDANYSPRRSPVCYKNLRQNLFDDPTTDIS